MSTLLEVVRAVLGSLLLLPALWLGVLSVQVGVLPRRPGRGPSDIPRVALTDGWELGGDPYPASIKAMQAVLVAAVAAVVLPEGLLRGAAIWVLIGLCVIAAAQFLLRVGLRVLVTGVTPGQEAWCITIGGALGGCVTTWIVVASHAKSGIAHAATVDAVQQAAQIQSDLLRRAELTGIGVFLAVLLVARWRYRSRTRKARKRRARRGAATRAAYRRRQVGVRDPVIRGGTVPRRSPSFTGTISTRRR